MDDYASYYDHITGCGCQCPLCVANSLLTWLRNYELQADANQRHVQSWNRRLALSQDQILHFNAPIPPQLQSCISAQEFLAQEDAGLARIPSEFNILWPSQDHVPAPTQPTFFSYSDTSPAQHAQGHVNLISLSQKSQNKPAQLQVQPSSLDQSQVLPAHEETRIRQVHDAPQVMPPALFQSEVAQPGAPKDVTLPMCPFCGKSFHRIQERDRHLRRFLPSRLFCPFEGCDWRGDRYCILKGHWEAEHANSGRALPTQEHCEIYDSGPFVKLILCQLSTEEAAGEACSKVERRAQELGKVGVWKDAWGRRRVTHCQ